MKINWQTKKLDEICNVDYGIRIVKTRNIPGDFDVYGGGGKTFTSNEYNREDCFIVSRFAMSANCVRKVEGKFFLNDSGLSVSTKDENLLSQDFLDRFLLGSQDVIYSLGRGQAQRNLHIEGFKNLQIPLPPLATQQKIVARLDKLLGNIAQVKQLRQEAIADTEKILSQTLREIFEEGKQKGWEEDVLNNIAKKVADGTHDTPKYTTEGYPLITSKNLLESGLNFANVKYISEEDYIQIGQRSGVEKDDLLIAMIGTIGNITMVETDQKFSIKNVGLIKPNEEKVLGKYILYFLHNSRLFSLIESKGATQKFIALGPIRNIKIQFPPLPEQHQIVTRLDALSAKLHELRQLQAEQLEDLKKLEKAYLREVFNEELI